jgi:uncharacterized protein YkwD
LTSARLSRLLAVTALIVLAAWAGAARAQAPSYRTALLRAINAARASHGLRPVRVDSRLGAAALAHTRTLVKEHTLTHSSPDGAGPAVRVADAGFHARFVGENLAMGYGPWRCVAAWLASPEHRDILLSPRYKAVGIAAAMGTVGAYRVPFITADFGG